MKIADRIQARLTERRVQAALLERKYGPNGLQLKRAKLDIQRWTVALELAQAGREFDRPEAAYYAAVEKE